MNTIDEMKQRIEETREELNKLVLTGNYESYCAVSQEMDALIEQYIETQALAMA